MQYGNWKLDDVRAQLSADKTYTEPFLYGKARLGLYAPVVSDPQQPHEQDEFYFVQRGTGIFVQGDERTPFGPGDALFVAAGAEHRFEDFSADFCAWVVFWGPEEGVDENR